MLMPLPIPPSLGALNEGRGRDPGDTLYVRREGGACGNRSTKAGAETPATLVLEDLQFAVDDRSTKAGAETPATRSLP